MVALDVVILRPRNDLRSFVLVTSGDVDDQFIPFTDDEETTPAENKYNVSQIDSNKTILQLHV